MDQDDPAGRRFTVSILPKARQRYLVIGSVVVGLVVFSMLFLLSMMHLLTQLAERPSTDHGGPGGYVAVPILLLIAIVVMVVLALYWSSGARKVVIGVTTGGLTISKRAGDVFSFRDAELGQWRGGRPGPYVGRALFLTSGPHRFVLGDFKDPRNAGQVPIEGAQVRHEDLDAWTKSSAFDELLAIVGAAPGR